MPWGIYISIEAISSQSECEVLPVEEEDTKDKRAYVLVDTLYTKKEEKKVPPKDGGQESKNGSSHHVICKQHSMLAQRWPV